MRDAISFGREGGLRCEVWDDFVRVGGFVGGETDDAEIVFLMSVSFGGVFGGD